MDRFTTDYTDKASLSSGSHRLSLPLLRAVQGAFISLLAPLGWIVVQSLAGRLPFAAENVDPLLYGYMTIATAVTFSLLGYAIGRRELLITSLALTDGLTGLYNKRYFFHRLTQEFNRCKRSNEPVSLILLDLDHFKKINDQYGHNAGDEVLRVIARALKKECRNTELAIRVGGEEICIIAIDCDLMGAERLAERLRKTVEELEISWQNQTIRLTTSCGTVTFNSSFKNPTDLYQAADEALYQAKQSGRNRVCSY